MEINLILIFMITAAIAAIRMKDLLSSLIALSAAGLGLSLAFLVLKAPNLAITQLVVEILCVIILIRGTISKDIPLVIGGRWLFNTVSTFAFIIVFLLICWAALRQLPSFGAPIMQVSQFYIAGAPEAAHSANIVSAITLFFRNFDALGEAVVVFSAMIGVLVIARKSARPQGDK